MNCWKDLLKWPHYSKKWEVTGAYAKTVQPRSEKSKYDQTEPRLEPESFTPTWLVEKQNGYVEAELESLDLEDYIQLRWLEITCGEAPYMVTRYDTVTVGNIIWASWFVDRKLQRISREVQTTFYELVKKLSKASYGYGTKVRCFWRVKIF